MGIFLFDQQEIFKKKDCFFAVLSCLTKQWNTLPAQSSLSTGYLVRSRLRWCPPSIPNNLLRRADGDFAAGPEFLDLLLHGSAEKDSQRVCFLSLGGQVGKKGIISDILIVRRKCDLKSKRSL